MQTIDVQGQSGTAYRFRQISTPDDLPSQAGNFLRLAPARGPAQVLACGTRRSLLELAAAWADLTRDGAQLFVRLNVARATRLAEHDDLAQGLAPVATLREAD